MSSVDCNAEEINTVKESASMVPDPYLQRADQPRSKPAKWDSQNPPGISTCNAVSNLPTVR
jgi:hypothetical protein